MLPHASLVLEREPSRLRRIEGPFANVVSNHNKVPIRVLHENLFLPALPVTCPTPHLSATKVDSPISDAQGQKHWSDIREIDLEHGALAKRLVQRPGFKAAMPLAKHDLVPLGMFQIGKSFFCSFKSGLKAQYVAPE